MNKVVEKILLGLITLYRRGISPFMTPTCRYLPTCSAFAHEAIVKHGGLYGSWLTLKRLCRCHPWGRTGFDPVPAKRTRACNRHPGVN